MTDSDGNVYPVVAIGDQCWMTENLRTATYSDSSSIDNVTDGVEWVDQSVGAWCNYDNDTNNDVEYGKLYNWYAVNDQRGLCPNGWHVPSDVEWQSLEEFLGMPTNALPFGWRGESENIGDQLKSPPPAWNPPATVSNNSSGFSGTPSGRRHHDDGAFEGLGNAGQWWSSTQNPLAPPTALFRELNSNQSGIARVAKEKETGFSVRCVKD